MVVAKKQPHHHQPHRVAHPSDSVFSSSLLCGSRPRRLRRGRKLSSSNHQHRSRAPPRRPLMAARTSAEGHVFALQGSNTEMTKGAGSFAAAVVYGTHAAPVAVAATPKRSAAQRASARHNYSMPIMPFLPAPRARSEAVSRSPARRHPAVCDAVAHDTALQKPRRRRTPTAAARKAGSDRGCAVSAELVVAKVEVVL